MIHGVSPLGYSFWQSFGPALLLLLFLGISRHPFGCSKRHLTYYVFSAISGIALPNSLMYFSAAHLPSGFLAIMVNTVPIFTYPLALLIQQEQFQVRRCLAVALGCLGIFSLILLLQGHFSFTEAWIHGGMKWALLSLLSPLSFAICSIFIAHRTPTQSSALSLSVGMLLCSTLFLSPFVIETHQFYALHFPLSFTDALILIEILLSSLGYLLFFALLQRSGAVYYSMVGGLVAIFGLLWGHLFFAEHFTGLSYFPIALILFAIVLLSSHSINHRKS